MLNCNQSHCIMYKYFNPIIERVYTSNDHRYIVQLFELLKTLKIELRNIYTFFSYIIVNVKLLTKIKNSSFNKLFKRKFKLTHKVLVNYRF